MPWKPTIVPIELFTQATQAKLVRLINTWQLNESHCKAVLSQLRVKIVLQITGHFQLERFASGNQKVVSIQSGTAESVLTSANAIGRRLIDGYEIV